MILSIVPLTILRNRTTRGVKIKRKIAILVKRHIPRRTRQKHTFRGEWPRSCAVRRGMSISRARYGRNYYMDLSTEANWRVGDIKRALSPGLNIAIRVYLCGNVAFDYLFDFGICERVIWTSRLTSINPPIETSRLD